MNKGKVTCEKLKAIRREVAEKLGIEYSPKECTFEGDCLGTCPLCQQETDMLMEQVKIRLEERPELWDELQCTVFDVPHMEYEKDGDSDEVVELGMPVPELLEGLVDVDDDSLEGESEPLMGDIIDPRELYFSRNREGDESIPMMGMAPPLPDYSKIAPFCKYYDPIHYWEHYPEDETDLCCLRSIEKGICNADYMWDIIFDAENPQLAFEELFVQFLYMQYPEKYLHLLQVFFADHPTYKKQLMAKVMSIKKQKN